MQVWNFQNGHNLRCLEPVAEAEVTGVMPLVDRNVILAVGWSRLITSYDNSDPDVSSCFTDIIIVKFHFCNQTVCIS